MTNTFPLTVKDIARVRYWLRGMRGGATSGLVAGMLFLCAAGMLFWAMTTTLQDDSGLPLIIFVLAGIGIFFLIKAANFIQRRTKSKKSLLSAQKERVSGSLESVTVQQRRMRYQIDGQSYDVNIVPGTDKRYFGALYRNLFDVSALQRSAVVLDLLRIDEQQFLLLDMIYEHTGRASQRTVAALPQDFSEGKKAMQSLRFIAGVFLLLLLVSIVICWSMYDSKDIPGSLLLAVLQSVFLLPAVFVYYKKQKLQHSDRRWIVEGTVTEVIKARERFTRGGSYTTIIWYRIGSELICSYGDPETPVKHFNVGEKVQAVYLCDQQLNLFRLIEITVLK